MIQGVINPDSDSEEEDHVWKTNDTSLKGVRNVIDTLVDPVYEWNKQSSDGKKSMDNFIGWLDAISDQIYQHYKKNNDEDIFNN